MLTEESSLQEARECMVREQLMSAGRGIVDERVLAAMRKVPRHAFVPRHLREMAYDDCPLPIGGGQTISQPYIVALMTELLEVKPGDRVLEIGTGSGYQAAVLVELGAKVFSVECREDLAREASRRLAECGVEVALRVGNGWDGWAQHAPYDRIVVTCAPPTVPAALVEQLADPGQMVLPVGRTYGVQRLTRLSKAGGEIETEELDAVRFVPMEDEPEA